MLDEYTARNNAALVELVEKHNVDVRPYPDDVIASLKTLSEEVFAELATEDKQFAKVYASYSDYLTKVRKYHEISEEAYFEKR